MALDPRKQECIGLYLYGAGYFARDENTLGILAGTGVASEHFCQRCPLAVECGKRQRARVRAEHPEAVERFERLVAQIKGRGGTELLAEIVLASKGLNPFLHDANAAFKLGHAERGRVAGPLAAPRSDPDVG